MTETFDHLPAKPIPVADLRQGPWRLDWLLPAAWCLLWPPFVWLLSYRSFQPSIAGRWSMRLFLLVIASAGGLLFASLVLWRHFRTVRSGRRSRLQSGLAWLRPHRWLLTTVALGAVLCWTAAVAMWAVYGPDSGGIVSGGWLLLDSWLLLCVVEAGLLLADRPVMEQRHANFRLCASIFAIFLTLGAAEIAGRLLNVAPPDEWHINPPYRDAPFQTEEFDTRIAINRQGLREAEPVGPKPQGTFRVLVIGDSMIFGHGVNADEAIPQVTAQLLKSRKSADGEDQRFEVINVSRQGSSPADYLQFLSKTGQFLQPDLIVVGFYVGNDCPVEQPFDIRTQEQLDRILENARRRASIPWWQSFCLGRLAGPLLTRWSARAVQSGPALAHIPGEPNPLDGRPNPLGVLLVQQEQNPDMQRRIAVLRDRGWIDKGLRNRVNPGVIIGALERPDAVADMMFLRKETKPAMEREWSLCTTLLDDIVQHAQRLNAPIWFLALPQAYQISPASLAALESLNCLTLPEMLGNRALNDRLIAYCRERGLPCLDPWDALLAQQQAGQQVFYPVDTHLTVAGNRVVAEVLAAAIRQIPAENGNGMDNDSRSR